MVRTLLSVMIGASLIGFLGCVTLKAPEKIEIGNVDSEPVDSSRVPHTANHEEARRELARAYQRIQQLEHENDRLARQATEYKRERDDARQTRR